MIYLHLRTGYERVADAVAHLSEWAGDDTLTLSHDRFVAADSRVSFCVSLEDDATVLEGSAVCDGCRDHGDEAAPLSRFSVVLGRLAFDERGEAMWSRIKAAKPESEAAKSRPPSSRPLSAAPPPLEPETPKSGDTRVVSVEQVLRASMRSGVEITAIGDDPSIGPTTLCAVPLTTYDRASRLAERLGEGHSTEELVREALRLGLAVLEEQKTRN